MNRAWHRIGKILPGLILSVFAAVVQAQVTVVNMIPNSRSGETNQDSEPNLAVNPANPLQVAASAFTPDPLGGPNAPIYVSTDGGNIWALNSILPGNSTVSGTGDITLRFGGINNALYGGILRGGASLRLHILRTSDFTLPDLMTVLVDRSPVDQPYVQATTVLGGDGIGNDRVFVGNNDFTALAGRTATADRSLDGLGATPPPPSNFTPLRLETRATVSQDGPQIRPAFHADGTVYAVFYGWRSRSGSIFTSDVVVVRDDNWTVGPTFFAALTDPGDGLVGRRVVTGISVPFINSSQADFGQERVGGNLSIEADPRNSSRVYLAFADYPAGTTTYTVHVRRSDDRGATWTDDLLTIPRATNPALAVNIDGKVGCLYQQVTGTGPAQRWETHLQRSADLGTTWDDLLLARPPATTPAVRFLPYIGDYLHLMAVGEDFYGVFSANNTPDLANFPQGVTYQRNADFTTGTLLASDGVTPVPISIDPFFFRVVDGPPAAYVRSVNAASYDGSALAPESIVAAFGTSLATTIESAPPNQPLPTSLAGTTVRVKDAAGVDRLAPLFFVSPGQVNYQMPAGTALGTSSINVTSGSGSLSRGSSQIAAVAPGLFSADASGQGVAAAYVLRVREDGSQVFEPVAQCDPVTGQCVAVPIDFGLPTDTLYLILFGTGIRGRSSLAAVAVTVGTTSPTVLFAGPQGDFVGEDQVNVGPLSRDLAGTGVSNVVLTADNRRSNTVTVTFK